MANRRPQQNTGRRMDFGRDTRNNNFGRVGVSPWQSAGPGGSGLPNLLPLGGDASQATLALASNIINLLQPRQNPVPSLLDMPIRRDFGPNMGRFDRGFGGPNRMGNQNFRRTGNYNRSGERVNNNRKPFRPNDGQRQQNKSSPKKDADSKSKPKESDQNESKDQDKEQTEIKKEPEDKKEGPKTRYDDINSQFLKCHICNKSMWDGRSFENHLNGRAHAIMMQKTAESYALTADTMRQEFKIRHEMQRRQRTIELRKKYGDNYDPKIREMKRTRKTGAQPARDFYCAMCDMYAADGAAHRTTVGHRKLKKYLHPSCICCHKEMPTRIELDEHRLTAEHLRNMQDKQEVVVKVKPEVMVISTLAQEQSYLRDDRQRTRRAPPKSGDGNKEDGVEVKKEGEDGENAEEKQTEGEKKEIDCDKTIVDYMEGDDLTGVAQDQFPVYSVERGVGRSFLADFRCIQCKLCKKLLDTDETAEVHLKTWRHHQLFLRLLNEKTGRTQNNEQAASSSPQHQSEGNKRPMSSEENGNWKRRKVTDGGDSDTNCNDDSIVKEEHEGEEEFQGNENEGHDGGDADSAMPNPEDLEDWEHTTDEILNEEQEHNDTEQQDGDYQEEQNEDGHQEDEQEQQEEEEQQQEEEEEEQAPEPEPEPRKKAPAPVPAPAQKAAPSPAQKAASSPAQKAAPSPRGRGRGRPRRY